LRRESAELGGVVLWRAAGPQIKHAETRNDFASLSAFIFGSATLYSWQLSFRDRKEFFR
jgi:hypothetical protein